MIELPETFTISKQMKATLPGHRIERCIVNQSPMKFAFYKPSFEEFPDLLTGRMVVDVTHNQRHWLQIELDQGGLDFGDFGGRILLHQSAEKVPAKHQLLLELDDGRILTASIVLWGFLHAVRPGDERGPAVQKTAPLEDGFTFDRFQELLKDPSIGRKTSVKYFIISQPGLGGVGNGCLQDILFNASIHPRRAVISLTPDEQHTLYTSIQSTLRQMIDLGGRDSERDLYNQPGGYPTILSSRTSGTPCPRCGTAIEKIAFLGGACYLCPHCQI